MRVNSYLIQRLSPPITSNHPFLGADNPFAFGGGLRNGGLSDEAMDLLRGVWSFDYMGAAEFEFGEVPKTLSFLAEHANAGTLEAFEFSILYSKVKKPWGTEENPPAPRTRASIYVIAPTEWHDEVVERVTALAGKNPPKTKEAVNLASALRPGDWTPTAVGWLEISNGYLFFIDRDMWAKAAALFEINVDGTKEE